MYTLMKSKSFSSLFIVGLLLLFIFSVSECFAEDWGWKRGGCGGNIYASQIIQMWDAKWFHYKTETCPLKVNAHDYDWRYLDEETGWQLITTDWRDPALTFFTGDSLIDPTGDYTTWTRVSDGPTGVSGVTITYRTDDRTTMPSPVYPGESINDSGPIVRNKKMYAYEAVAYLNCNGSSGSPTTGPIFESTGSDQEIFYPLNYPEVVVDPPLGSQDANDFSRFATATWILNTNPTTATLDSAGQLRTVIGATASGQLKGTVYDQDPDCFSSSVTVTPFAAGGLTADITIDLPLSTDAEGKAGLGFAFSSDLLGDDDNDEIEITSSDYWFWQLPKTETKNYSHTPSNNTLRGGKGKETVAKSIIEAEAKAQTFLSQQIGYEAHAKIQSCAGSGDGGVGYSAGVPTYEPGGGFVEHPDW